MIFQINKSTSDPCLLPKATTIAKGCVRAVTRQLTFCTHPPHLHTQTFKYTIPYTHTQSVANSQFSPPLTDTHPDTHTHTYTPPATHRMKHTCGDISSQSHTGVHKITFSPVRKCISVTCLHVGKTGSSIVLWMPGNKHSFHSLYSFNTATLHRDPVHSVCHGENKEHCHLRSRCVARRQGVIQWGQSEGTGVNGVHRVWGVGGTEPQGKRGQDLC